MKTRRSKLYKGTRICPDEVGKRLKDGIEILEEMATRLGNMNSSLNMLKAASTTQMLT